jgi:hypothetical protein
MEELFLIKEWVRRQGWFRGHATVESSDKTIGSTESVSFREQIGN